MVKPANLGSSVGISLVHDPSELPAALDEAFRHDDVALAEAYLPAARDLEVSVLGNDHARLELYGPGEILAGHEFYDYEAKYTPGLSETSLRAEVPGPMRATILKIARDAYRAIGAEGFARVDFLVSGNRVFLSEINTIPGFTPISLFPTLPVESGRDFADVCATVVDLALERHAGRARRRLTPADLPR
jgi:D-alanine-D-alanine ligase